jgi:hypothetical protein
MPPFVPDLVICALIVGLTYALMSEGLWGAALMFFNVLFAGMIAFNFYEPLAALLAQNVSFLSGLADTLCLMSLFIVSIVALRLTTETLAPAMVRFPAPLYHLGRVAFGLAGGVVALAIITLSFETAPVNKKILGVVDYKSRPPFKLGIDHEWLGFFQWTTGAIFPTYNTGARDPYTQYGTAKVFDPRAEWLINHQNARPYGTETVPETEAAAGAGAEGAAGAGAGAGAAAGGGGPGGAGGRREGDPQVVLPSSGAPVVIPP